MGFIVVILVVAGTFGLCYLADHGFSKLFRGTAQHRSGRAVRLSSKYGAFGAILIALGVGSAFAGTKLLLICGPIIAVMGSALVVYYMTFGLYYDDETFLLSSFGKKSKVYRYEEIRAQQLYTSAGGVLIELHLADGRTVGLQAAMNGAYAFLDCAFAGWCVQTGKKPEDCAFHDPANSCWFPRVEAR